MTQPTDKIKDVEDLESRAIEKSPSERNQLNNPKPSLMPKEQHNKTTQDVFDFDNCDLPTGSNIGWGKTLLRPIDDCFFTGKTRLEKLDTVYLFFPSFLSTAFFTQIIGQSSISWNWEILLSYLWFTNVQSLTDKENCSPWIYILYHGANHW